MILLSPFPVESAAELCRWLNSPREPNFMADQASDLGAVLSLLAQKTRDGLTFAAVIDGRPAGFLGFQEIRPGAGQFAGMVMAPEYRGRGWGTAFVRAVTAELSRSGYREMIAAVRDENVAIQRTFARAGYASGVRLFALVTNGGA